MANRKTGKNKSIVVLPQIEKNLKIMGEQIKLARKRRHLSVDIVCNRADISRTTLWKIENGSSKVAMGAYCNVLHALGGLDTDILKIAKDDELGRKLQDIELL